MRLSRAIPRLLVCLAPGLCPACTGPEPPGELVGAYRVEGALLENTCGSAAVPAADPLSFDVEVRADDTSGYWLLAMPPANLGRVELDGDFRFVRETSVDLNPQGAQQEPAEVITEEDIEALADPERAESSGQAQQQVCRMLISERIEGKLQHKLDVESGLDSDSLDFDVELVEDDIDSAADMIGENEITMRSGSGSSCNIVLEANGGPFEKLPCTVRYAIEGALVEEEDEDAENEE